MFKERAMFTDRDKNDLLKIARTAIKHYFEAGCKLKIDEKYLSKPLKEKKGAFVTLTIDNELRGCIGHILPVQELYKDVIDNAINAAFHDMRFPPLAEDELKKVKIEVSVLSAPKKLDYAEPKELLNRLAKGPGRPGVIIKKGLHSATFLPQVWEQLPAPEDFLSSLCIKAGLNAEAWKTDKLNIETYYVEAFEES